MTPQSFLTKLEHFPPQTREVQPLRHVWLLSRASWAPGVSDCKIIRQRLPSQGLEVAIGLSPSSLWIPTSTLGKEQSMGYMMEVSPGRNNESRCYDPKQYFRCQTASFSIFPKWIWRLTYSCNWVCWYLKWSTTLPSKLSCYKEFRNLRFSGNKTGSLSLRFFQHHSCN